MAHLCDRIQLLRKWNYLWQKKKECRLSLVLSSLVQGSSEKSNHQWTELVQTILDSEFHSDWLTVAYRKSSGHSIVLKWQSFGKAVTFSKTVLLIWCIHSISLIRVTMESLHALFKIKSCCWDKTNFNFTQHCYPINSNSAKYHASTAYHQLRPQVHGGCHSGQQGHMQKRRNEIIREYLWALH